LGESSFVKMASRERQREKERLRVSDERLVSFKVELF
jgi:hypothetical protein